jgi:hypothetical protein
LRPGTIGERHEDRDYFLPNVTEQQAKVASLATLIKKRLGIETMITPGSTGQFEMYADGERVAGRGGNWFTRSFGAGYPDLDGMVEQLEKRRRQ